MQTFTHLHLSVRRQQVLQLLIKVKITSLILLVCIQVQATGLAQSVSLDFKNARPELVLQRIADQIDYNLVYSKEAIKHGKLVTISADNIPFTEAIAACMKDQPFAYVIANKSIVLSRKNIPTENNTATLTAETKGRIIDENGKPITGATIRTKKGSKSTISNENGEFSLADLPDRTTLLISCVGYSTVEIELNTNNFNDNNLTVILKVKNTDLQEVTVQAANTGYYEVPKERSTGSFDVINNKDINRRVSTNILDRIDGISSGVMFNKNFGSGGNIPQISIRGRSTLFANAEPLIILDNFPYQGGLNNINPNDIETITVLKDAAASSIWGTYSGNGVIVLTSKKGKRNQPTKVSFTTNMTIGSKPNLFHAPQLSSAEMINVEKHLFGLGIYDVYLDYVPYWVQSPAVEIMDLVRRNIIDQNEADRRLATLGETDSRNDQLKYFYRNSTNQQYNLNISGGGNDNQYYLSVGYDNVNSSMINENQKRFTLTTQITNFFFDNKLETSARILLVNSKYKLPAQTYTPRFPYEKIATESGTPLPVTRDYRIGYIDTISTPGLMDWHYYPLSERQPNSLSSLLDVKVDANVSYKLFKGIKLYMNYQYGKGATTGSTIFDESHYSLRNLYNSFTSIDQSNNNVSHAIPKGSLYSSNDGSYSNSFLRTGVNINHKFNADHEINTVAGFEVRKVDQFNKNATLYGYDPITATSIPVDYNIDYQQYFGNTAKIAFNTNQYGTADRNRTYFVNASYIFQEKYTVSGSARKDESNLFGVKANQKGVPLWSVGGSWEISKEKFYPLISIPYLRLRTTYGLNGNVDKTTYAFTTINLTDYNYFNQPVANIINPANPSLRWEKVKTFNVALDFSIKKNIIRGSIEYYSKTGTDLIGYSPIAPQTGVIRYRGNVANTETKGMDFSLSSKNINKSLKWNTDLIFSIVKDKVTNNKIKSVGNISYASSNTVNPLEGYPFASLYSFKWAGLDSTGDPLGFVDGKPTNDYTAILNSNNSDELIYSGSFTPTAFGSIRNSFTYKGFEISINVIYKGGYVFRKEALQYGNLFSGGFRSSQDYVNRWQKPGDENKTNVPSLKYPNDQRRDDFYRFSEIHIQKADHIRLQDIRLTYDFNQKLISKFGLSSLNLYGYVNNVKILWKANSEGLDPDAGSLGIPMPTTYAIGLNLSFK